MNYSLNSTSYHDTRDVYLSQILQNVNIGSVRIYILMG